MSTAQEVIAKAQFAYPDLPSDVGLSYLNDILKATYAAWALRSEDIDVALVADDMDYTLPDRVNHIWSAEYLADATDALTLQPGSQENFERFRTAWRHADTGTPSEFFIWPGDAGFELLLWPPPDMTSDPTSGYPKVRLYCTVAPAALSLNSTIPPVFVDDFYLKSFISMRWAQDRHPQDFQARLAAYEMDRVRQNSWLRRRNIQQIPQMFPLMGPMGTRPRVV